MNRNRKTDPEMYEDTIKTTVDEVQGTIDNPGRLIDKNGYSNDTIELNRHLILIGNDRAADIIVNDSKSTDYIAEITFEGGLYFLRRLADKARVTVCRKPVKVHILNDGDEIQLADRTFIYKAPDRRQGDQE
jgi:pSer/pThr/pTyr-binding forkhead associated (FHA) protein